MGSDNNSPIFNTSDSDIGSNMDAKSALKMLRTRNLNRLIIGYLNINSIRNKLESLSEINSQNIDISMVAETKLETSFPNQQFSLEGYSPPIRLDRNRNGGCLLMYIRNGIAAHQFTSLKYTVDFECLTLEVTVNKKQWVLFGVYRPPVQPLQTFLDNLGKCIDHYSPKYDKFMLFGDFNAEETEDKVNEFMDTYNLTNLVKSPTCFKSNNHKCIDLILANRKKSIQTTTTV